MHFISMYMIHFILLYQVSKIVYYFMYTRLYLQTDNPFIVVKRKEINNNSRNSVNINEDNNNNSSNSVNINEDNNNDNNSSEEEEKLDVVNELICHQAPML